MSANNFYKDNADRYIFADNEEEAKELQEDSDKIKVIGCARLTEEDIKNKIAEAVKDIIQENVAASPDKIVLFGKKLSEYKFQEQSYKNIETPEDFDESQLKVVELLQNHFELHTPVSIEKRDISLNFNIENSGLEFLEIKLPGEKIIELAAHYYFDRYKKAMKEIDSRYFNLHPINDDILLSVFYINNFLKSKLEDSTMEFLREAQFSAEMGILNMAGYLSYKIPTQKIDKEIIKHSRKKIIDRLGARKRGGADVYIGILTLLELVPFYQKIEVEMKKVKKHILKYGFSRSKLIDFINEEIEKEVASRPDLDRVLIGKNLGRKIIDYFNLAYENKGKCAGELACSLLIKENGLGVEPDTFYRQIRKQLKNRT